jgi:16S rRNA (cytosine1402-N4)-methyltransferase
MRRKIFHNPVLAEELINLLGLSGFAHSKVRGKLIDATFGLGGCEKYMVGLNLDVLGIEIDQKTINKAKSLLGRLKNQGLNCHLVQGNFKDIRQIALKEGFESVDAVIFDLGVSSFQLDSDFYGLSFKYPETLLDMRLDKNVSRVTASDLLNVLSQNQLISLFEVVLDKNLSARLAKSVVERRKEKPFAKVKDLLELVDKAMPKEGKLHPATKVFLALRMAVNSELENLELALPDSFSLLKKRGRLAVISFHSGEDRIVKNFFDKLIFSGQAVSLTKKPVTPGQDELILNPRSRSAKLRIIEKI